MYHFLFSSFIAYWKLKDTIRNIRFTNVLLLVVFPNHIEDNFLPFFFSNSTEVYCNETREGEKRWMKFLVNRAFLDQTLSLYETFFSLFHRMNSRWKTSSSFTGPKSPFATYFVAMIVQFPNRDWKCNDSHCCHCSTNEQFEILETVRRFFVPFHIRSNIRVELIKDSNRLLTCCKRTITTFVRTSSCNNRRIE